MQQQDAHDAALSTALNRPAAHATHEPPLTLVPGAHWHAAAPAGDENPDAQGMHVLALVAAAALEAVLAGQVAGAAAASLQ